MTKKQLLEMLGNVKNGNVKIDTVLENLQHSRKMEMTETKIELPKGMNSENCYFVKGNKIFSLPLTKLRNDGRNAEFVPYYRTVSAMEMLNSKK